jgi:hypothetical protein
MLPRCSGHTSGSQETLRYRLSPPVICQRESGHKGLHLAWVRHEGPMGAEAVEYESLVGWLRPADTTIIGSNVRSGRRLDLPFEERT